MSQTFYVNLFHNGFFKFSGFKKKLEPDTNGGTRPVMLPMSTKLSKSFVSTCKRFPYRLDPDKNIRKFGSGSFEIAFLVPSRDVPNLSDSEYEDSLYFKLGGSDDKRKAELQEQVESLQDKLGKKNKQLRELREEEEEQNKGRSGGSQSARLRCPRCGDVNNQGVWRSNGGICPSCEQVAMDDPEVVRE